LVNFINLVKDKCDQIDHHPEWSVHDNQLDVKLTSHYLGNKVGDKDWELAAYMSQYYNERNTMDEKSLKMLRWLVAIGLISGSYMLFKWIENVKFHHRLTSMDFIFQRVDTKKNDYYAHIKP
jgi:hypothetical protein